MDALEVVMRTPVDLHHDELHLMVQDLERPFMALDLMQDPFRPVVPVGIQLGHHGLHMHAD